MSLTTVQDTWRRQTVQFVRRPTPTGAVDRPLGRYSNGILTAESLRWQLFTKQHFQVTPLSILLDLAGGIMYMYVCMYISCACLIMQEHTSCQPRAPYGNVVLVWLQDF